MRHHASMQPNLRRIPDDGDAAAKAILNQLPEHIDSRLIESLDASNGLALARFGIRSATLAMRWASEERLRDGLLASALDACRGEDDPRELMVAWALHFFVAEHLRLEPRALFQETADRLPAGEISRLLREFGARDDVTLDAFAWRLIYQDAGPDFIPVF